MNGKSTTNNFLTPFQDSKVQQPMRIHPTDTSLLHWIESTLAVPDLIALQQNIPEIIKSKE